MPVPSNLTMEGAGRIARAMCALAIAWACLVASLPAGADATTYSTNKRTLRVGVLLLDSTAYDWSTNPPTPLRGGAENPDPFLFHIADSRTDIKPANWEFVNPLAPKVVTTEVFARWSQPGVGRDPDHPYRLGQQVTKNMAAYWEVPLSTTSLSDLLQYDLLFVTNHRTVYLTPADREKMRKLVDAGGVLWFEDCSRMRFHPAGPFFLEQVQFTSGGGDGVPEIHVPGHPLLTSPYPLTRQEIGSLGDVNMRNGRAIASIAPGATDPTAPPLLARPNPSVLVNVVGNSAVRSATGEALPYIAAGIYGSGAVLLTAGDSGCDINDYCGGVNAGFGGNSGAYSGSNLQAARTEDLKFLYNAVSWGTANNAYRRNNRRTATSFEIVGAPLIDGFTAFGTTTDPGVASGSAPLIAKGLVVVSGEVAGGSGATLRAYVAQPSLAAGDRGLPDLVLGTTWDEVWRVGLGGTKPSSPVLGSVNLGGPIPLDAVFVTLSDGTLARVPVDATDAAGNLIAAPTAAVNAPVGIGSPSTYVRTSGGIAPAPVYFENRVYVVEPSGLVRCVDASTMETLWWSFAEAQTPTITPTGTPTLGVVRQDVTQGIPGIGGAGFAGRSNGNTNDIMLYVPVADEDSNANILSYFLGTRHEVVRNDEAGSGNYRTRVAVDNNAPASNRNLIAIGDDRFVTPRVRVYDNETALALGIPSSTYAGTFRSDASGFVEVRDTAGSPPVGNPRPIVSVDYDVLYVTSSATPGGLGNGNGARQGQPLQIPLWTGPTAETSGLDTAGMTPEDLLFYAFRQTNSRNSTVYTWLVGAGEQFGVGTTKLRQAVLALESVGPISAPVDTVTVTELPTFRNRLVFSGPIGSNMTATVATSWEGLTNVVPVGAPILSSDGNAYLLASAVSAANGGVVTVLAAVRTDGVIALTLPEAYNPAKPVTVRQLNAMTYPATGSDSPQTLTAVLPATGNDGTTTSLQLTGDPKRGRIVVTDMRHPSGARFSATLSFVVTYTPSGTEAPVTVVVTPTPATPDTSVGQGEPGAGDTSPRILGGGYTPIQWYYILPGRPTSAATLSGGIVYLVIDNNVVAVDANPAETNPGVRVGFGEQVLAVAGTLVNGGTGSPVATATNHVRWVRALGAAATAPPVIGQGVVAVNTAAGTRSFQAGTTLIADSKRVLEVAADGSAEWVLDSSSEERVVGGELPIFDPSAPTGILNPPASGRTSTDRRQLSRPATVRKLSASDYLIADTGNNRILRVDRAGRIRWQLTRVNDPFGVLASGDSKSINGPTDVRLYLQPTPNPSDPTAAPVGYEAHYLVADAGNFRVIEVVDYFDVNGNYRTFAGERAENVVVWVSRTKSREGRNLRFQSAQRVSTSAGGVFGIPTVVAVVGNQAAGGGDGLEADNSGGALVRLDYRPFNTYFVLRNAAGNVLPPAVWPDSGNPIGSGYPWPDAGGASSAASEPASNGRIASVLNEMVLPDGRVRRVVRPTYFEQLTLPGLAGASRLVYLICDAEGVWQVEPDATGRRAVTWSFTQADYDRMNVDPLFGENGLEARLAVAPGIVVGAPTLPRFQPTSVRRLSTGNLLVTNAFAGPNPWFADGQFRGEVFEVTPLFNPDGTSAGGKFGGFSVPRVKPVRFPLDPSRNRNEQLMGAVRSNTSLVEQPLSGDRLQ